MIDDLLKKIKTYNPGANTDIVVKAYELAVKMHEGQLRHSGEKYIIHPLAVAGILAELEMDVATISAGILHDVVEDTSMTYDEVAAQFGKEIADLVDGVTKLGKMKYRSRAENQTENFRKMFMAMAKDIRVVLIKLSDRLHNARTFKYMTPRKTFEKSTETLEIFSPIAGRLGISKIQWELEDISIRYLEPKFYFDLERKIRARIKERDVYINQIIKTLEEAIKKTGMKFEIYGREKHIYSIYKKMKNKHKAFEEIYDLIAVRVIAETIPDCYGVMGIVHSLWKPIIGRIKDYIANPKTNMYQSLHTTILGPDGMPVEVQIRTAQMHRTAEYGVAAHWKYKDGRIDPKETDMDKYMSWLRQMLEWQHDIVDPDEFMNALKVELFGNQVFVTTPRGDIVELPAGSTPVDLAYKIHTAVGNACVGAKIGGKIVPLDTTLKNGDIVQILTSPNSKGPSRDWLNVVKSSHARNKIRQWFKKERREENIEKGKEILEKDAKRFSYYSAELVSPKYLAEAAKQFSQSSVEEMCAALGYGGLTINQVMIRLRQIYVKENADKIRENKIKELAEKADQEEKPLDINPKHPGSQLISVKNTDNILTRLAKCCNPLPGDEIIGYITKGSGVTVHRKDCINLEHLDREKLIEVNWNLGSDEKSLFDVHLKVIFYDRNGFFADVSRIFEDENVKILGINAHSGKRDLSNMDIMFEIVSKEQLRRIKRKIKSIPDVQDVFRENK